MKDITIAYVIDLNKSKYYTRFNTIVERLCDFNNSYEVVFITSNGKIKKIKASNLRGCIVLVPGLKIGSGYCFPYHIPKNRKEANTPWAKKRIPMPSSFCGYGYTEKMLKAVKNLGVYAQGWDTL